MNSMWPMVPLGNVIEHRKEFIIINDSQEYNRCRVQLHAKGIVLRDVIEGALLKTKQQQVCQAGEFLVAEIDAKVGGYGIVPEQLHGAIVSSHYFLFEVSKERLDERFLDYFIRTRSFHDQVLPRGSTNYAAIRPQHVLEYEIPLPPLSEQRRLVARIERLAAKVEQARSLRRKACIEAEALPASALSQIFDFEPGQELPQGWTWKPLTCLLGNSGQGIRTGPFGTLLQKSEILGEGVPVVGIANVEANKFVWRFHDFVSEEKAKKLSQYELRPLDIVIARSGTVGRSCVVPHGIQRNPIMSTNLIRLRLDTDEFSPDLLSRLFNGSRFIERHKEKECRGSTRTFFTQKILKKLTLPVPPVAEQLRIVASLYALQVKTHGLKRLQEETAAELDALLPAILDKAFKGEL